MSSPPAIHLCIVQPLGYVHALGFLDQARYYRYQLRRLGAEVSMAKNRLRHDAVNLVFGAHLGFDAELRRRHACIFVNLEQLGEGGARVDPSYLALLRQSAVADYDADNLAAYAAVPEEVPLLPLLHAPYLADAAVPALEDRPIDLLFFGSMNDRRRALLARIEAQGVTVSQFDGPIYGPERDAFIGQAKAVYNAHFYASSRFEQARVSHCLSLGTPVVAERGPATQPHPAFEDAVHWVRDEELERFFATRFGTPEFFAESRAQLQRFIAADPLEHYADLLAFASGYGKAHGQQRPQEAWRPQRLNLGSGKDYKPGWLNLDVVAHTQPDLLLDLGRPVELPLRLSSPLAGEVLLEEGQCARIYANNVLEHVPDLPCLMGNLLRLLQDGGELEIEVPYERALTAWQDPTHVRAMNENSWRYYTDWFWYLGWFNHRFEVAESTWLNDRVQPCDKAQAAFMRMRLRKIFTSAHERTVARTMRADFGELPDDWVDALPAIRQAAA
ncbi:class I SAM-dependent methyltransferase [Roseateles sp. DAIF2]|uniref:methyltransferase domain-containing protein n=1 Tax=Roseateles sp. DAIF2 TaxID=2714952 RepID=UPI0018A29B61|nr:methyltransferase domain-containing protein [Roseateles sp. DAIF2]QPF73121.1 class I SAM-dependent methyltransferase [Roseateles sp. DAIF2]